METHTIIWLGIAIGITLAVTSLFPLSRKFFVYAPVIFLISLLWPIILCIFVLTVVVSISMISNIDRWYARNRGDNNAE